MVKKSGLPSAGGQIQVSGAPIQVGGTAGQIKILPKNHAASLNSSSVKVTPIMVNKPVSTVQVNATKVVNTAPRTLVTPVTAATAVTASKAIKFCAQCKTKPSKFECGGCSKIWYCSRECQELNWDSHENECGVTDVKKEIVEWSSEKYDNNKEIFSNWSYWQLKMIAQNRFISIWQRFGTENEQI